MSYLNWLPRWCSGKDSACQCRWHKRHSFHPWVRKIPLSWQWHPTLVFLPGKFHGQRTLVVYSLWGLQRVRHDWASIHTHTHTHTHPNLVTMHYYLLQLTDNSDQQRWSLWLLETLIQKNINFSCHCWEVILLNDGIGICNAFIKSK